MKYFIDTNSLSTYIKQHDLPCLENWIDNNLLQFVQHECNSTAQLKNNIVNLWQKFAKDKETNKSLSDNLLNNIFLMNAQTSVSQREAIMMWFYSLCEKNDVENVWKKVKNDIDNLQKTKTKNPACMLDLVAVRLLHKFNDLTKDEFVALKLAISRIVDFLNDDILDVFKNYVDPFFWEVVKVEEDAAAASATAATEEEEALVKSVFDPVIEKSNEQGVEEAQILIAEKKISLLKENKRHSLEYNLVLVADFIFNNIEDWGSCETTEAQVVANISIILNNIFKNTKLKIVIGEIGAECTKETRKSHETSFSGGCSSSAYTGNPTSSKRSKNICGRKADLAVIGEEGVELALCEFKAGRDESTLKKQEGKNLRYNQCVLESLKEYGLKKKIVAFNWGENRGEMFSLEEIQGVFVARSINKQMILPDDPRLLNQAFVDTMTTFCAWRRHLIALNEEAFVAIRMRGDTSNKKRKTFITCFSPKWEVNKK